MGGVLLASSLFAETSSEVQVGAAYEPSCTIEMPSSIAIDLSNISLKAISADGPISPSDWLDVKLLGTLNCAKELSVTINAFADSSNGNFRGTEGSFIYEHFSDKPDRLSNSGIFPITNTPDVVDNGVYSVGISPGMIYVPSNEIANYDTKIYNSYIGIGTNETLTVQIGYYSHNCPLIPNTLRTNCPAGDITGSVTVSLSW